jgi:hypothetical protein
VLDWSREAMEAFRQNEPSATDYSYSEPQTAPELVGSGTPDRA